MANSNTELDPKGERDPTFGLGSGAVGQNFEHTTIDFILSFTIHSTQLVIAFSNCLVAVVCLSSQCRPEKTSFTDGAWHGEKQHNEFVILTSIGPLKLFVCLAHIQRSRTHSSPPRRAQNHSRQGCEPLIITMRRKYPCHFSCRSLSHSLLFRVRRLSLCSPNLSFKKNLRHLS